MALNSGWQQAEHLLAVRLDTLGDVLMTTPAIRALRESGAGRRITLLTSRRAAGIARLVPEIDEVMVYDAPWMKATAPRQSSAPDAEMIEALRERAFDAAVIFTVYSQDPMPPAFLCYLADIPRRLAYSHSNPYQMLTDWVPDPEPGGLLRHEVQRHLDLVATVGARTDALRLSLRPPEEAYERVGGLLAGAGVEPEGRWVVVHPGASAPSRRWPPGFYAEAVRRLAGELGLEVVLTGVRSEAPLVEQIRRGAEVGAHSLAGRLDLEEMAALLAMAPLLISNNTGPAHMAAAVGTPVVDLYALTNPQHTPWGVPARVLFHDVPCRWCYRSICPAGHHNCLRLVTPDEVIEAAVALLDGEPAPNYEPVRLGFGNPPEN